MPKRFRGIHFRQPWVLLALTLGVFFVLDGALFRSNFYLRWSNPFGFDNSLYYAVHFENKRKPSGKKEIFIVGNSKIENGFSILDFEKLHPEAPIKFIRGSAPATEPGVWYFTLKAVDPSHDRYAAIVVPMNSYQATPDGAGRVNPRIVLPIMSVKDWPELLGGDMDADMRSMSKLMMAFPSHFFLLDLVDFAADTRQRLAWLKIVYRKKGEWEYDRYSIKRDGDTIINTDGNTMEGFRRDEKTGRVISYPDNLMRNRIAYIDFFLRPRSQAEAERNTRRSDEHTAYWIKKLIGLYANSPTRLIFLQVPREPFAFPAYQTLPNAPDIRNEVPHASNVIFLDSKEFMPLETPHNFYDPDHLNPYGRLKFTEQFGDDVLRIMSPTAPAALEAACVTDASRLGPDASQTGSTPCDRQQPSASSEPRLQH